MDFNDLLARIILGGFVMIALGVIIDKLRKIIRLLEKEKNDA